MITIRQHEKLIDRIKSLSELELASFVDDFAEHVHKNKLNHVIESRFEIPDYSDEIDRLERDLEHLEEKKDDAIDKLDSVMVLCSQAEEIEEFEENAFSKLMNISMK